MANIDLGGGIVVSDDQVRAAGGDPDALRRQLAFGSSVDPQFVTTIARMAGGKQQTSAAAKAAAAARTICEKYDDAVKNRLPLAIQTSLRNQCAASRATAVSAGAPDDSSSGGSDLSPALIVGGLAAVGAAAYFLFIRR